MMDKSFKKASQKNQEENKTKTASTLGSVSRLAGSAHRWVELYADGVH
jgi:hypothetical protein